jgi:transposase
MNNNTKKGPVTVLRIDLAKQSFQLHGVNDAGQVVIKKKLNRTQLSTKAGYMGALFLYVTN